MAVEYHVVEYEGWWDDPNHPMFDHFHEALAGPWLYLDQGWPLRLCPLWSGRGLVTEVGSRVWHARQLEPMGWWPPVLDDFEQILDEIEMKGTVQ